MPYVRHEKPYPGRSASFFEVIFVALVLFCLPLFEAPKNISSLLFCVIFLLTSIRTKNTGANCNLNWPIWGLVVILWLAPFFSEYGNMITALDSAPRWTLLALFVIFVARLDYSRTQLIVMWGALLCGGAVAVIESFWIWHFNGEEYPELRSVGHVNHSAMYLLVVLGCALAASCSKLRVLAWGGTLSILLFFAYLRSSKSGVALITTLVVFVVYVGIWIYPRFGWKRVLLGGAVTFSLGLFLAAMFGGELWQELATRLTSSNISNGRWQYVQIALEVYDRHPLFGTGWYSFAEATSAEVLSEEIAESGNVVDFAYAGHPHGHNLWTTMLIERGLAGVALVTILLFLYLRTFLPIALSREQLDPVDRGAAVGAVLVAVGFAVAGLGNTTMMNEHGHAGMAFISVVYGYLRGKGFLPSRFE